MKKKTNRLEEVASYYTVLSNPIRLGILTTLYGGEFLGRPCSLRFSEIKNVLGIASDTNIFYHLGKLLDSGLIERSSGQKEHRIRSIYRTSKRGRQILLDLAADKIILDSFSKFSATKKFKKAH